MKSSVNGQWRTVSRVEAHRLVASTAFGRGVFTTLSVRHGQPLFLNQHLARLKNDARCLAVPWPGDTVIRKQWHEGRFRNPKTSATLRIIVRRHHSVTELLLLFELPRPTPRAASLILAEVGRPVRAQVKSLGYPFWHSYREQARHQECFDVVAHADGGMLESSLANVFFVTRQDTITPPADGRILPGIARELLLRNKELRICQRPVPLTLLQSVDAIFCTNSVRGVIPVDRIIHPRGAVLWRGGMDLVRPFHLAWQQMVQREIESSRMDLNSCHCN